MSQLMKRRVMPTFMVGAAAVALAACGSSSSSGSNPNALKQIPLKPGESPIGQQMYNGKKGGTLQVYDQEDFEHLDPGQAYFAIDYEAMYATQRPLLLLHAQQRHDRQSRRRVGTARDQRRRQDRDDPHQAEHHVRAAGEPGRHLGRRRVRDRAGGQPERLEPILRPVLRDDRRRREREGHGDRERRSDRGITTPNPTTIVFKLTARRRRCWSARSSCRSRRRSP